MSTELKSGNSDYRLQNVRRESNEKLGRTDKNRMTNHQAHALCMAKIKANSWYYFKT
jgi:hypothetical protein